MPQCARADRTDRAAQGQGRAGRLHRCRVECRRDAAGRRGHHPRGARPCPARTGSTLAPIAAWRRWRRRSPTPSSRRWRQAPSSRARPCRSLALQSARNSRSARFRQREGGENHDGVSNGGENADRRAKPRGGGHDADQHRKKRAQAPTEIVAEALARAAHARWIKLRENRPMPLKMPDAKKPSGNPSTSIIESEICISM